MAQPEKTCLSCGRRITWRKKWERDWDQVRYCSQACRRRGVDDHDSDLEATLRDLLTRRPRGATVTDAELAAAGSGSAGTRSAGTGSAGTGSAGTGSAGTGSAGTGSAGTGSAGTGSADQALEPARRAARRLHAAGEVEILQRGRAVDPSRATGPIDIRSRR